MSAASSSEHDRRLSRPRRQRSSSPGISNYPAGGWDLRPHRARVLTITEDVLADWARLFDEPGTPAAEARLASARHDRRSRSALGLGRPAGPTGRSRLPLDRPAGTRTGRQRRRHHPWEHRGSRIVGRGRSSRARTSPSPPRSPSSPTKSAGTTGTTATGTSRSCLTSGYPTNQLPAGLLTATSTSPASITGMATRASTSWRTVWRRMTQPGSSARCRERSFRPARRMLTRVHSWPSDEVGDRGLLPGLGRRLCPSTTWSRCRARPTCQDELARRLRCPLDWPLVRTRCSSVPSASTA